MILFIPKPQSYLAATVAGSGNVVRWTYTVPVGKRAVLTHAYVTIIPSAAAAATTSAIIATTIGGVYVEVVRIQNGVVLVAVLTQSFHAEIDLQAGDTVTGNTINNAAVASTMFVMAAIREYQ